jgi:hypothetical protein
MNLDKNPRCPIFSEYILSELKKRERERERETNPVIVVDRLKSSDLRFYKIIHNSFFHSFGSNKTVLSRRIRCVHVLTNQYKINPY